MVRLGEINAGNVIFIQICIIAFDFEIPNLNLTCLSGDLRP